MSLCVAPLLAVARARRRRSDRGPPHLSRKAHPISPGRALRILIEKQRDNVERAARYRFDIVGHPRDRTLLCSASQQPGGDPSRRLSIRGRTFVALLGPAISEASMASATASTQHYAPLMRNTPARSGRLPIRISAPATSTLPVLPFFDPRATARSLNVQARRLSFVFEWATPQEDSTPLDTHPVRSKSRIEFHAIAKRRPRPSGTGVLPMRGHGCADWRSTRDRSHFQPRVPHGESRSHRRHSTG
jgi:hypothetical protein